MFPRLPLNSWTQASRAPETIDVCHHTRLLCLVFQRTGMIYFKGDWWVQTLFYIPGIFIWGKHSPNLRSEANYNWKLLLALLILLNCIINPKPFALGFKIISLSFFLPTPHPELENHTQSLTHSRQAFYQRVTAYHSSPLTILQCSILCWRLLEPKLWTLEL